MTFLIKWVSAFQAQGDPFLIIGLQTGVSDGLDYLT